MGKTSQLGKTSQHELNAHKYKKFVGSKREGTVFYDVFLQCFDSVDWVTVTSGP